MIEKKLSVAKQMGYLQPKQLRNYIRSGDSDVILVLCECLHRILLSHVRVKPRGLEKYRHIFEGLIKKTSSMDKRQALLLKTTGSELIQLNVKFCFIHLS